MATLHDVHGMRSSRPPRPRANSALCMPRPRSCCAPPTPTGAKRLSPTRVPGICPRCGGDWLSSAAFSFPHSVHAYLEIHTSDLLSTCAPGRESFISKLFVEIDGQSRQDGFITTSDLR